MVTDVGTAKSPKIFGVIPPFGSEAAGRRNAFSMVWGIAQKHLIKGDEILAFWNEMRPDEYGAMGGSFKSYQPSGVGTIPRALSDVVVDAVADGGTASPDFNEHRKAAILRFVNEYGLLTVGGPPWADPKWSVGGDGKRPLRESVALFWNFALRVHDAYQGLQVGDVEPYFEKISLNHLSEISPMDILIISEQESATSEDPEPSHRLMPPALATPTLRAAITLQLHELAHDPEGKFRFCKECGRDFVASHGRTKFCPSPSFSGKTRSKCAERHRKRLQRSRRRAAEGDTDA